MSERQHGARTVSSRAFAVGTVALLAFIVGMKSHHRSATVSAQGQKTVIDASSENCTDEEGLICFCDMTKVPNPDETKVACCAANVKGFIDKSTAAIKAGDEDTAAIWQDTLDAFQSGYREARDSGDADVFAAWITGNCDQEKTCTECNLQVEDLSTPNCGDRIQQRGEECDHGKQGSASCTPKCAKHRCGDGILNPDPKKEECDDGNKINGDGCSNECKQGAGGKFGGDPPPPGAYGRCGDRKRDGTEECDDGNTNALDTCSECMLTSCGDGKVQNPNGKEQAEECDQGKGNGTPGSGCTSECKRYPGPPGKKNCGNGVLDMGEQCDQGDANGKLGSGCAKNCTYPSETVYVVMGLKVQTVGNCCFTSEHSRYASCERVAEKRICTDYGSLETPEDNYKGSLHTTRYACEKSCTSKQEYCGDGVVQKELGEECDLGAPHATHLDVAFVHCRKEGTCPVAGATNIPLHIANAEEPTFAEALQSQPVPWSKAWDNVMAKSNCMSTCKLAACAKLPNKKWAPASELCYAVYTEQNGASCLEYKLDEKGYGVYVNGQPEIHRNTCPFLEGRNRTGPWPQAPQFGVPEGIAPGEIPVPDGDPLTSNTELPPAAWGGSPFFVAQAGDSHEDASRWNFQDLLATSYPPGAGDSGGAQGPGDGQGDGIHQGDGQNDGVNAPIPIDPALRDKIIDQLNRERGWVDPGKCFDPADGKPGLILPTGLCLIRRFTVKAGGVCTQAGMYNGMFRDKAIDNLFNQMDGSLERLEEEQILIEKLLNDKAKVSQMPQEVIVAQETKLEKVKQAQERVVTMKGALSNFDAIKDCPGPPPEAGGGKPKVCVRSLEYVQGPKGWQWRCGSSICSTAGSCDLFQIPGEQPKPMPCVTQKPGGPAKLMHDTGHCFDPSQKPRRNKPRVKPAVPPQQQQKKGGGGGGGGGGKPPGGGAQAGGGAPKKPAAPLPPPKTSPKPPAKQQPKETPLDLAVQSACQCKEGANYFCTIDVTCGEGGAGGSQSSSTFIRPLGAIINEPLPRFGDQGGSDILDRFAEEQTQGAGSSARKTATEVTVTLKMPRELPVTFSDLKALERLAGDGKTVTGAGEPPVVQGNTVRWTWTEAQIRPLASKTFTLVVLPDTQYYSRSNPEVFAAQTRWVTDNAAALNIPFVMHLGDVTHNNNPPQWANAAGAMNALHSPLARGSLLAAVTDGTVAKAVPFSILPGNHDTGNNGKADIRDTTLFNQYFPLQSLEAQPTFGGAFEPGKSDNTYHLFSAGGVDWLVLALEFGPRDPVLEWANDVVARHANRKVIITTHSYLTPFGKLDGDVPGRGSIEVYGVSREPGGVNTGLEMWHNFVKKHSNILLVLNGHDYIGGKIADGASQLLAQGDQGNTVYQMLSNYQKYQSRHTPVGGGGFLRLIEIDTQNRRMAIRTFSPTDEAYAKEAENEFVFDNVDFGTVRAPSALGASLLAQTTRGSPRDSCITLHTSLTFTLQKQGSSASSAQNLSSLSSGFPPFREPSGATPLPRGEKVVTVTANIPDSRPENNITKEDLSKLQSLSQSSACRDVSAGFCCVASSSAGASFTCADLDQDTCSEKKGTFYFDETKCQESCKPQPPPDTWCCDPFNAACQKMPRADCLASDFIPYDAEATCKANCTFNPPGVCCNPQKLTCAASTHDNCSKIGGSLFPSSAGCIASCVRSSSRSSIGSISTRSSVSSRSISSSSRSSVRRVPGSSGRSASSVPSVFHTVCQGFSCVEVFGPGTNECSPRLGCGSTHTECDGNAQCRVIQAPGGNRCGPSTDCIANICGNGKMNLGEECEIGFVCTGLLHCDFHDCKCKPFLSSPSSASSSFGLAVCGNGVLDAHEICDDGNTLSNDGCSAQCAVEPIPPVPPPPPPSNICGDERLNVGEGCDDGNQRDGDGCSHSCQLEPGIIPRCGDRIVTQGEECDDGNTRDFDGCSSQCLLEEGKCHDDIVQQLLGEQCEPRIHDLTLPYGCGDDCRFTSRFCGNGMLNPGEQCDEGSENSDTRPDTCRTNCSEARCGDNVKDSGEGCDDGNRLRGDGCDTFCRSETYSVIEDVTKFPPGGQPPLFPPFPTTNIPAIVPLPWIPLPGKPPGFPPVAQLRPIVPIRAPVGDTGPAALAIMAGGAAAGLSWMRRRARKTASRP